MKSVLLVLTISGALVSMAAVAAGQSRSRGGARGQASAPSAGHNFGSVVVTTQMPVVTGIPPSVGVVIPQTSPRFLFQPAFNLRLGFGGRRGRGFGGWIGYGYPLGLPFGAIGGYVGVGNPPGVPIDQPLPDGHLLLEVEPHTAQVYVDGYYVGTVDDVNRNGGRLGAGPHQIELTEPGYEPVTVAVQMTSGQTVTYRSVMQAVRPPAIEPLRPSAPQTFYFIPDCYMGNRPPSELVLPPGCDASRVRTYMTER
jgi:hypothetical protein